MTLNTDKYDYDVWFKYWPPRIFDKLESGDFKKKIPKTLKRIKRQKQQEVKEAIIDAVYGNP